MIFRIFGEVLVEQLIIFFCILYLIILSVQDIFNMQVSNIAVLGFLITIVSFSVNIITVDAIFSALFFFILLFLVSYITHGLGSGDIKIMAILAYAAGFFKTCITGIVACVTGIIAFIVARTITGQKIIQIPFVPCITAGYITSLFIGEIVV